MSFQNRFCKRETYNIEGYWRSFECSTYVRLRNINTRELLFLQISKSVPPKPQGPGAYFIHKHTQENCFYSPHFYLGHKAESTHSDAVFEVVQTCGGGMTLQRSASERRQTWGGRGRVVGPVELHRRRIARRCLDFAEDFDGSAHARDSVDERLVRSAKGFIWK